MSKVLNFLESYNPKLITVTKTRYNGENYYRLNLKRNNKVLSYLDFSLSPNQLYILDGKTHPIVRSQGYGTLLRALATKAGQIAGVKVANQEGMNKGQRSLRRLEKNPNIAKPYPTSTWILVDRLGWKLKDEPGFNNYGRVATVNSSFNYSKNNMAKVNAYLANNRFRAKT